MIYIYACKRKKMLFLCLQGRKALWVKALQLELNLKVVSLVICIYVCMYGWMDGYIYIYINDKWKYGVKIYMFWT